MFTALLIAFLVMTLLAIVKQSIKEKVNWWQRKWRMESKLEELERRVGSLEEMNELRGEGGRE